MENPELFSYETTIKETSLDIFGHVNNAEYLRIFEEARWEFITEKGFGLARIKKDKVGPVILEVNLKFKKELVARDEVVIESQFSGMKKSHLMTMNQKMKMAGGEIVAAELDLLVGLFDLKKRKLILPSKDWMNAIGVDP